MKRVLITGAGSYIGTSFEKWLAKEPDKYKVDTVDMISDSWRKKDFSGYDVVFHVAGIAHTKVTKRNQDLYYKINRDLAYETAKKAKEEGVKQFIFLSSMSVYGVEKGVINENTPLKPNTAYGKSKLEAEELINKLQDKNFIVTILRPPMVYGKGCKGNYSRLAKLALITPIFPEIKNKRSMIYIDNLLELIKQLIDHCSSGLFFPQNDEYVNTSEMVRLIAQAHGKEIWMTKLFNPLIRILSISTINKMFGDLVYDKKMSYAQITGDGKVKNYIAVSFDESIRRTEN
jgi:nucleoside-diphosphate-sugar epimerase